MRIADITIGKRVREDLGDLDDLCRSIEEVGLLQPVVVTSDGELVAGARRVAAFKKLGRDDIPAVVADNLADALLLLKAERDENVCRKDFTPEEGVTVGEQIKELFRLEADAAKKAGAKKGGETAGRGRSKQFACDCGEQFNVEVWHCPVCDHHWQMHVDECRNCHAFDRPEKPSANLAEGFGETRKKVAVAVGMKHTTYDKAKAVVAAKKKDPERFAAVADKMNKTGNVDAAFREVKKAEKEEQRAEAAKEAAKLLPPEDFGVRHGDFREVVKELEPDSVDLIFTDPPYDRDTLPLYGDMAREAARVLKPGGSLVCYLGQFQIHEVCNLVTPHLRLWWTLCCLHTGQSARMTEYGIVVKWKPMLWFVKGTRGDKQTMVEDLVQSRQEKDTHEWQQGVTEAAYYIDKLTLPGGFVFDPFCGGGTTAVACKQLKRRWLTCDTDKAAVPLARKRIHES